jgi:hypothetical protein
MSSTTQSAENCIANGLTFNLADIDITAPKLNKSGGKSANILYRPSKKGVYINMQVPMLTWGASCFKDPQSGKETFDMSIQFPRKDYSTPDTDTLLAKFQELEKYIKSEAVKNSMAWFNKKTMTPEVIEALWTPMLKYTKDQQTGETDMTKAPTLKVKLPCWEGKFNCEIYDPQGTMLYPDESAASSLGMISFHVNPLASSEIPSKRVAIFFLETRSVLVTRANFFARGYFAISAAINSSPAPDVSSAGRHIMTISTESMLSLTTALRRCPSRVFGLWTPGVSTRTA